MLISVAGICLHDGCILLGKRASGGSLSDRWEFPGGKVDGGETPQQALQREFVEELAVPVAVGDRIAVGCFEHKGGVRRLEAFRVYGPENSELHLNEHVRIEWVPCCEIHTYNLADSDRSILDQILTALGCC